MLINAAEGEESRLAVVENEQLEEIYVERAAEDNCVGNIYKGVIVNVEPSIQAAFVDFGGEKNGFLHISDVMPLYGRRNGNPADGKRADIQTILQKGQEVLVQITKDQIGAKVPTLTTYISLPGRCLVLMPSINKCGVSKKITDESERRQLRELLRGLNPPPGMGYIIRTAVLDRSREELARDLQYLLNLWRAIQERVKKQPAPSMLYRESDLVIRTIRDLLGSEIDEIVTDSREIHDKAREFLRLLVPGFEERVSLYDEVKPLFHRFGIEHQIEQIYNRRVPLPSGGSIVLEQTEALVAIDVNSGKFKEKSNLEETAFRTNIEAAEAIVRQIRLRDLGGLIVCDFIDMREDRHRNQVERLIRQHLRKDRARVRVARMSKFCIVEMTRQRVRESLKQAAYQICAHCAGSGFVKTRESMALHVTRELKNRLSERIGSKIEVVAHPEVASMLSDHRKAVIQELQKRNRSPIVVRGHKDYRFEEFRIL